MVLIDALDESSDDEVQDMILWLQDFASHAVELAVSLRICFSSCHYPHIEIGSRLSIVIDTEPGHDRDIQLYVQRRLLGNNLERMEPLRRGLLRRSQGIFVWVVLAIRILNRLYDQDKGIAAMERKLDEVARVKPAHQALSPTIAMLP